jgi:hypothetical protein
MHPEDTLSTLDVRAVDHDLAIEATGSEQSRIEHVGTVGRRQEDHSLVRLETVHLHQKLVEGLLALVVAAA